MTNAERVTNWIRKERGAYCDRCIAAGLGMKREAVSRVTRALRYTQEFSRRSEKCSGCKKERRVTLVASAAQPMAHASHNFNLLIGIPLALSLLALVLDKLFLHNLPKNAWSLFGCAIVIVVVQYWRFPTRSHPRIGRALLTCSALCVAAALFVWIAAPPRGVLVPASDSTEWLQDCYDDKLRLIIGRNVIASDSEVFGAIAFENGGLAVTVSNLLADGLVVSADVRNEQGEIIAEVERNAPLQPPYGKMEIWLGEGLLPEQDQVIYTDQFGKEILVLRLVNEKTVRVVRGVFKYPDMPTLAVNIEWIYVDGQPDFTRRCILLTGPEFAVPSITKDGISWRPRYGQYSEPPRPPSAPPPGKFSTVKGSPTLTLNPPG